MSKIRLLASLEVTGQNPLKQTWNSDGIKDDKRLIFKEEDVKMIITFDSTTIILERKHPEYTLTLHLGLKKSMGIYELHQIGKIDFDVITKELLLEENKMKVKYKLGEDEYTYLLEYEEVKS